MSETPTRRSSRSRIHSLKHREAQEPDTALTPRTRRKKAMTDKGEERKEINRIRQESAAIRRKASSMEAIALNAKGTIPPPSVRARLSTSRASTSSNQAKENTENNNINSAAAAINLAKRRRPTHDAADNQDDFPVDRPSKRPTRRQSKEEQEIKEKEAEVDEEEEEEEEQMDDTRPCPLVGEDIMQARADAENVNKVLESKHRAALEEVQMDLTAEKEAHAKVRTELTAEKEARAKVQDDLIAENGAHVKVQHNLIAEREAHAISQEELSAEKQAHAITQANLIARDHTITQQISLLAERDTTIFKHIEQADKNEQLINHHTQVIQALESQAKRTQTQLRDKDNIIAQLTQHVSDRDQTIEQAEASITGLKERCVEEALARRSLHHKIQELRGNVRVFARVRPLLDGELDDSVSSPNQSTEEEEVMAPMQAVPDDPDERKMVVVGSEKKSVDGLNKRREEWHFTFDKCFRPHSTQANIFEEVSHLVQSTCDGYRVCIFAYGQSGSGKTFTMEGADPSSAWGNQDSGVPNEHAGVIPRAVQLLFETAKERHDEEGWEFEISASYLEIYNEELRDLLASGGDGNGSVDTGCNGSFGGSSSNGSVGLEIKHRPDGETFVLGLRSIIVKSAEDVRVLMQDAAQARTVAATQINDRSSRSHAVFQLSVKATNKQRGETRNGIINLIDLAGSERLKQSQAQGVQLKEAQAINKSLSCLGDVIFALANKSKHVPYRNSKLTHVLRDSLGGNSKTLMFVNVAPTRKMLNESLCALRFGQKVNACEIGTASRNSSRK